MNEEFEHVIEVIYNEIESSINQLLSFWRNNQIYFVCSLFYYVLTSFLLGGTKVSFLIVFVIYAVIGFSEIGEKLLRLLNHVRPLETKREIEYLQPLFDEVYKNAKSRHKKLSKIEVCVVDTMSVNASALGRRTIAVTKGAMQTFSEDELKAVMAHEVAHIVHGDTLAMLYTLIGNGIFSFFVLLARFGFLITDWLQSLFTGKRSLFSALMFLLRFSLEMFIWVLNFGLQVIQSINSRKNEFRADKFAYRIGYHSEIIEALYLLEKISLGDNSTVIQKMLASHPRITKRIQMLELLANNVSIIFLNPLMNFRADRKISCIVWKTLQLIFVEAYDLGGVKVF